MKENSFEENITYCLILKLRNHGILPFSIKPIPLPELAQRHSVLFFFKLILSIGSVKLLFNFKMLENWEGIYLIKEYSLFNFVVKKDVKGKIEYKLYFFRGRTAFYIIMNCCFSFCFGSSPSEVHCKTWFATKRFACSYEMQIFCTSRQYLWKIPEKDVF